MTEELFAYLMDDLSPECRAEVEQKLGADPAWQTELTRLQECLATSGDPRECVDEPPPDLVQRTCCLVEKVSDYPEIAASKASAKKRKVLPVFHAVGACAGSRCRSWSLIDVAVGGGVLALVAALVTPALFENRDASRRTACQNNLQTFGAALFNYQEDRGHQLPPVEPGESAGMYALKLAESGVISRDQLRQILICPESPLADEVFAGRLAVSLPSRSELQSARDVQRARLLKHIGGSYAYRLGYYDDDGIYQQVRYTGEHGSPLLGDAPAVLPAGVRSVNHGGNGFNVVDQGLCVHYQTDCELNGDDLYTNDDGEEAAGLNAHDVVLGRSEIGRDGPILEIRMTKPE